MGVNPACHIDKGQLAVGAWSRLCGRIGESRSRLWPMMRFPLSTLYDSFLREISVQRKQPQTSPVGSA